MIIHPEGQARVALGLPSVGPSRAAGEAREDYLPAVMACGYKFTVATSLLAILVLTHGIGLCGNQPVCRMHPTILH